MALLPLHQGLGQITHCGQGVGEGEDTPGAAQAVDGFVPGHGGQPGAQGRTALDVTGAEPQGHKHIGDHLLQILGEQGGPQSAGGDRGHIPGVAPDGGVECPAASRLDVPKQSFFLQSIHLLRGLCGSVFCSPLLDAEGAKR